MKKVIAITLSLLLIVLLTLATARIVPWIAFYITAAVAALAAWKMKK